MVESSRTPTDVWITGIGLVSSLGEGVDAHWNALQSGQINVDSTTFAPRMVHPLAPLNFDGQIPKKGDQRQMELWQRIGVYAAGLALDSAGIKGKADILGRVDMTVAANGGERDLAVDSKILTDLIQSNASPAALNQRLMNDLRPTLFLAQLSNLLAGNISIVHGVTGSSRTFMGEGTSGADSLRTALARIASGQSDIALVGAASNAERKEMLLMYEFGDLNLKDRFAPVWSRGATGGLVLGSGGAFIVLESRQHAEARGAKPFAKLSKVVSDAGSREEGALARRLEDQWEQLQPRTEAVAILSSANGSEPTTSEERAFLTNHKDVPVRATATSFGSLIEAQFALGVALAAMSLSNGAFYPPASDSSEVEINMPRKPSQIVVIDVGAQRGESMALIEAVG